MDKDLLDLLSRYCARYKDDSLSPSILISQITTGKNAGQWFVSIGRYRGGYRREVVFSDTDPRAVVALARAGEWLKTQMFSSSTP